jgi:SAM-dependent methyltransferase
MDFDKDFWERHWGAASSAAPNPYVVAETAGLATGTALDAGCGSGAEAIWLAARGWRVTAADISASALAQARARAGGIPITWVEADLTTWHPGAQFDLVMTNYAHPTTPQLEFYERVAHWVAPGGSLLIVGHRDDGHHAASVALADIVALLAGWRIDTEQELARGILKDVVVRATRN